MYKKEIAILTEELARVKERSKAAIQDLETAIKAGAGASRAEEGPGLRKRFTQAGGEERRRENQGHETSLRDGASRLTEFISKAGSGESRAEEGPG